MGPDADLDREFFDPPITAHPVLTAGAGSLNIIGMPRADRKGTIAVNANPNILVVLSAALLRHLRRVAEEQQIPLRWLVAGLVCDTFETGIEQTMNRQAACN